MNRRTSLKKGLAAIALATFHSMAVPASDDVVVIVNRDNLVNIDRTGILRIYTGAVRGWPDGSTILPFDLNEDSPLRRDFALKILGRSPVNLRAIWSQNIFTGKGLSPRVVESEAEIKRLVASNKNAVGYIRISQVDSSVRVLEP